MLVYFAFFLTMLAAFGHAFTRPWLLSRAHSLTRLSPVALGAARSRSASSSSKSPPPSPSSSSASSDSYSTPLINWFPGHINAATSSLLSSLRQCDVILEVRDLRAPFATTHPDLSLWCGGRPRIICLNKSDLVPPLVRRMWLDAVKAGKAQQIFREGDGLERTERPMGRGKEKDKDKDAELQRQRSIARMRNEVSQREAVRLGASPAASSGTPPSSDSEASALSQTGVVDATLLTDGLENAGPQLKALLAEIHRSGASVNERRQAKGLLPRPLRVGVVGYPNVGKSALINRVLGRRRAKSADTPGVTRQLTWVRVSSGAGGDAAASQRRDFEMLDSPGLLPQNLVDQHAASLAAIVNAIGLGGYDSALVASALFDALRNLDKLVVLDGRYGKTGKSTVLQVTCPDYVETAKSKYKVDVLSETAGGGGEILGQVADSIGFGDVQATAVRVLNDFRSGRFGKVCLQVPRAVYEEEGKGGDGEDEKTAALERGDLTADHDVEGGRDKTRQDEVARIAAETGVILPPKKPEETQTNATRVQRRDLKKGRFDGW